MEVYQLLIIYSIKVDTMAFKIYIIEKDMNIIINGQEKDIKEGITLEELLHKLGLDGKVMAAAVNMDIVKQDIWDKHILKEDDKLELLDFVGGG